MGYYIGIDMGTSSVKLTLIDEQGNLINTAGRNYRISEPRPGWKEIDPEIWFQAMDRSLKDLLKDMDANKVDAIGVTGQMHTVIFADETGRSIRPALMWNDTRTADRIPVIKDQIRRSRSVAYLADIISTGSPAMNLLWLKENEPEHFQKIYRFLIGPDYIVMRLTGNFQTDYCEASTSSLFDLEQRKWSGEIRRLLGFPETIYPEVKGCGQKAGEVKEELCLRYDFRPGVRVIVGTGDNPAAAISTGCFQGMYPVLSLGTSGVLMVPKTEIDYSAKGKNILFSMDGKKIDVLTQGVVQACGNGMSWWLEEILGTRDYVGETEMDPGRLGESQLLYYPHLTGDKTIYADPALRGAFLGIGTDTSRKDMTIAVMEGIAFGIKQMIREMRISHDSLQNLRVIGGGSRNEVWMQIFADVLNVSIWQSDAGSGAGYGVALAALETEKKEGLTGTQAGNMVLKKVFSPRKYNVKLYEKKYLNYLKIHHALKEVFE